MLLLIQFSMMWPLNYNIILYANKERVYAKKLVKGDCYIVRFE